MDFWWIFGGFLGVENCSVMVPNQSRTKITMMAVAASGCEWRLVVVSEG